MAYRRLGSAWRVISLGVEEEVEALFRGETRGKRNGAPEGAGEKEGIYACNGGEEARTPNILIFSADFFSGFFQGVIYKGK